MAASLRVVRRIASRTPLLPALLAALGCLAGGCGPSVPAKPTWDHDVKPILEAHCYRCHDGEGPLDGTHESYKTLKGLAFPDQASAEMNAANINKAVHGGYEFPPAMPPPPAQVLADWQIETIENWTRAVAAQ